MVHCPLKIWHFFDVSFFVFCCFYSLVLSYFFFVYYRFSCRFVEFSSCRKRQTIWAELNFKLFTLCDWLWQADYCAWNHFFLSFFFFSRLFVFRFHLNICFFFSVKFSRQSKNKIVEIFSLNFEHAHTHAYVRTHVNTGIFECTFLFDFFSHSTVFSFNICWVTRRHFLFGRFANLFVKDGCRNVTGSGKRKKQMHKKH